METTHGNVREEDRDEETHAREEARRLNVRARTCTGSRWTEGLQFSSRAHRTRQAARTRRRRSQRAVMRYLTRLSE